MQQIIRNTGYLILLISIITVITNNVAVSAESSTTPKVPFTHALGMKGFQSHCALCHGEWGDGTKQGPPLMHPFYKPSHHPDATFYRAALKGVRAHHWNFGDMPPIAGVAKKDLDAIIPFIRWLQKERGLVE